MQYSTTQQSRGAGTAVATPASELLEAALSYARKGWHVFPVKPRGKTPITPNGQKNATTDEGQIRAWWAQTPGANVAIATEPSGLYVIDVDTKGDKVGAQTIASLEREHGELPETYTARTWSGGLHHFFPMPSPALRNSTGTPKAGLGPDVDTRGNGYVVAAPSEVHEDGQAGRYEVIRNVPLAPLPAWVAEKLAKPERKPRAVKAARTERGIVDTETGEVVSSETPPGLRKRLEAFAQQIKDEPPNGSGEDLCNRLSLEMSHYIASGQISDEEVRQVLTEAVDTWEHGHERGYAGIDHGLRHSDIEPWIWEERSNLRLIHRERAGELPRIDISSEPVAMRSITTALASGDIPDLYTRGGKVVRVSEVQDAELGKSLEIEDLTPASLRMTLADSAFCFRSGHGKTGEFSEEAAPTVTVAQAVLSRTEWPTMNHLAGVTPFPLFKRDGTVMDVPGYDAGTSHLLRPVYPIRAVGERPSVTDVHRARSLLLDEVLFDFAWDSDASRANFLALLFSPLLRLYVDTELPFGVLSATTPGSGKGLLAEVLNAVYTMTLKSWPKSDTECEKVIGALLRTTTHPVVLFDNVDEDDRVDHATLAGLLTSRVFTGRVLGESTTYRGANNRLWCVTGNNVQLGTDIATRSVLVHLAPLVENPDERSGFRITDLFGWLRDSENRSALLEALMILVRDWMAAGSPRAEGLQMRSFTEWAKAMGGLLAHHGISGFMANKDKLRGESDEDKGEMIAFLHEWHSHYGARAVKAVELLAKAKVDFAGGEANDMWQGTFPMNRDKQGKEFPFTSRALGKYLSSKDGKVYGRYRLEKVDIDKKNGIKGYRVHLHENDAS